jgi:alpha-L-rhamnosidase
VDIAPQLKPGRNLVAARVRSFGDMAPWAQMGVYTTFILQGDGDLEHVLKTQRGWRCYRDPGWEV